MMAGRAAVTSANLATIARVTSRRRHAREEPSTQLRVHKPSKTASLALLAHTATSSACPRLKVCVARATTARSSLMMLEIRRLTVTRKPILTSTSVLPATAAPRAQSHRRHAIPASILKAQATLYARPAMLASTALSTEKRSTVRPAITVLVTTSSASARSAHTAHSPMTCLT
jgi:hypothetical protein